MSTLLADISAAQGPKVDFDRIKAYGLCAGIVCKASEANGYQDPTFERNFKECERVGLVRGAYSFAHPDRWPGDALSEANFFLKCVREAGGFDDPYEPLLLALDMESSPLAGEEFTDWCLTWLEHVEAETGITPWLYTGGPFWGEHDGDPDPETLRRLRRFPLWLAAYVNTPNNFLPPGWDHWDLWQKSGDVAASGQKTMHIPGIGGASTNVDCDEFPGTEYELKLRLLSLRTLPPASEVPPSFPDSAVTLLRAGEGEHTPDFLDPEITIPGTPNSKSSQRLKAVVG